MENNAQSPFFQAPSKSSRSSGPSEDQRCLFSHELRLNNTNYPVFEPPMASNLAHSFHSDDGCVAVLVLPER